MSVRIEQVSARGRGPTMPWPQPMLIRRTLPPPPPAYVYAVPYAAPPPAVPPPAVPPPAVPTAPAAPPLTERQAIEPVFQQQYAPPMPVDLRPLEPPAWAEVALSVYELKGASAVNAVTETVGLGGMYHCGIEVYWLEWSYGWSPSGTGVHVVPVGQSKIGTFKERISLGKTALPPHEVLHVLAHMRREWRAKDYHYLRQNCGHFCVELARRLRVPGTVPTWVTSLAETGDWLSQLFQRTRSMSDDGADRLPMFAPAADGRLCAWYGVSREDQMVAKNELEWQWAQAHTVECVRSVAQQESTRNLQAQMFNSMQRSVSGILPHPHHWAPHPSTLVTVVTSP